MSSSTGKAPDAASDVHADSTTQPGGANVNELAQKTFASFAAYIKGDLALTVEDYTLLEEMNRIATRKYSDMRGTGGIVTKGLTDLNQQYRVLQPYLDQIDQLEASVSHLEQAAYRVDAYSKKLELKYKQIEKK